MQDMQAKSRASGGEFGGLLSLIIILVCKLSTCTFSTQLFMCAQVVIWQYLFVLNSESHQLRNAERQSFLFMVKAKNEKMGH
jgi:hypothetical protein